MSKQKNLLQLLKKPYTETLETRVKTEYPTMYNSIVKILTNKKWYIDLTYSEMSHITMFLDIRTSMSEIYTLFDNE